ncbi:MAG: ATP-dependent DNA helicase RecG [Candidatus Binatia bacterium]
MTPEAVPFAALVQALAAPLEYLAADDFRRIESTRLPVGALLERVANARREAAGAAAGPLAELETILRAVGPAPTAAHVPLLRQAHALLPRLRAAASPVARWTDYRATAAPVDAGLAALAQPAQFVRAVGPRRAAELERFGLTTVEDLLYHLPFRYEDRRAMVPLRAVVPGTEVTTTATVVRVHEGVAGRTRRRVLEVEVQDGDARAVLVWFNQLRYFARRFQRGQRVVVFGRVETSLGLGGLRLVHPEVTLLEAEEDAGACARVLPVYEKPTAMPVGVMRRIAQAAVEDFADQVPSVLPAEVAERQRVLDLGRALRHVHCPAPEADVAALQEGGSLAHRSLVFDELFFLQLGLALRRNATVAEPGTAFPASVRLVAALRRELAFRPTGAQERAFAEIAADLAAPHPMRRLLQGDVGSGKTLVALLAALVVIEAGYQVALMAPTELLAEQHLATVAPLLAPLGVRVVLLTGSLRGRERRDALAGLADGSVALAVGTHALIQEGVTFARLGLAIVDEQHRFGVLQRAALQRQSGAEACAIDVLVMSATPIPRTLALTLYGDLAVSTLDELPPGRTPITTSLCRESRRVRLYERVRAEVAQGHQAYVVYPLVEESERSALRSASAMARELASGPLAGLRVGLVHGRMKAEAKDAVMRAFKAREHDVLVSTTVIEVGIDVPNATVIVIEHAERFGLAQLHQLRGRVGRGAAPGYCYLAVPDWLGTEAFQRLRVLEQSTDGFEIAAADLDLRGPGDLLGTRQAGLPPFRVASLVRDAAVMRAAHDEAMQWLARDPELSRPESVGLRAVLLQRWRGRLEIARIG